MSIYVFLKNGGSRSCPLENVRIKWDTICQNLHVTQRRCLVYGVLIILVLTYSLCAGLCTRISLAVFPALISIRCISEDLKCAVHGFYILKRMLLWNARN